MFNTYNPNLLGTSSPRSMGMTGLGDSGGDNLQDAYSNLIRMLHHLYGGGGMGLRMMPPQILPPQSMPQMMPPQMLPPQMLPPQSMSMGPQMKPTQMLPPQMLPPITPNRPRSDESADFSRPSPQMKPPQMLPPLSMPSPQMKPTQSLSSPRPNFTPINPAAGPSY